MIKMNYLFQLLVGLFFIVNAIIAFTLAENANRQFSPRSRWIQAAPPSQGSQPGNLFVSRPFNRTNKIASATLYVSGIGYSKVTINGKPLLNEDGTEPKFEPGLSDFKLDALYVEYDVLGIINSASDTYVIGIQLGFGWMMPQAQDMTPRVRAELNVTFEGQASSPQCLVVTDGSWNVASGPIVYDNLYNGETYNASLEVPGWDLPNDYCPTTYACGAPVTWQSAAVMNSSSYNPSLRLRRFPSMRVIKQYAPVSHWMPDPNTLVVDFGIDISGFATLSAIFGAWGSVQMHYGEILDHYDAGMSKYVYFGNLRSALATDLFILPAPASPSPKQYTYAPTFTYHGFRFVQITVTGDVNLSLIAGNITANEIHSALDQISTFHSTTAIFDEIHTRVLGAQQNNFMSYSSDCNQRDERLGWDADAWLSSSAAWNNFDMRRFYENHIIEIHVDQLSDGAIGDVNPFFRYGSRPADPSWGLVLPYMMDLHYSETMDFDQLFLAYPYSVSWLGLLIFMYEIFGISNIIQRYGDWVPPAPAAKVSNGFASAWAFLYTMEDLRVASANLHNATQFAYYTNLLNNTLYDEFVATYFNPQAQSFDIGGTQQTTYTMPMTLPGVMTRATAAAKTNQKLGNNLLSLIEQSKYHLNTGILGLRFLFDEVSRGLGRIDVAGQMALQTSYPSYAYEWLNDVETPSTFNLWEVWNAPQQGPSMNSRDHHMDSSVDTFLFETVAGFMSAHTATLVASKHVLAELDRMGEEKASTEQKMERVREIHDKYGKYKTLVFDASSTSYDIPSLSEASISRKIPEMDNMTVSYKWRKEGGNNICRQFTRRNINGNKENRGGQIVELSCGTEGGVISEIDHVMVDDSALQGPNCASLHRRRRVSSTFQQKRDLHDAELKKVIESRCIGRSACVLSNRKKWWNDEIHNGTDFLLVRGRCSGSQKIFIDLEILSSSSQQQQQQQKQDFEIFVPVFGMHNPSIQVTSTMPRKMHNKQIHVHTDPNSIARHTHFSLIARSHMHDAIRSPAVVLVEGSLLHNNNVSIVVREQEQEPHSQKQHPKNKNNLFTNPFSPRNEENTCHGLGQVVVAVDRINSDYIQDKCGKISIAKLIQQIEIECVGKTNSCKNYGNSILINSLHGINDKLDVRCRAALQQESVVSLRCGQKSSLFDDFRME